MTELVNGIVIRARFVLVGGLERDLLMVNRKSDTEESHDQHAEG